MVVFFIVLGSIIFLYILISIILGFGIVILTCEPKMESIEARKRINKENGFDKGTENFKREPIAFTMRDGYVINGDISVNDPNKIMIFHHGHTSNREAQLKYARIFYKFGYSVVLIDARGHGVNKKDYVTMGYRESLDFNEIINSLKNTYKNSKIGVFGVSYGGATVLLTSKINQKMDFLIVDCPYATLKKELIDASHSKCGPAYLAYFFAKIIVKLKYHCSFKDIEPKNAVKFNKKPILLMHGTADKLVKVDNQKQILDNLNCYNEHYLFDGADHGESVIKYPELYEERVKKFLNNIECL